MAERFQNPVAEAIPGTPRIQEVRIESRSKKFDFTRTMRGGLRAEIDISPPFESDRKAVSVFGRRDSQVPFKLGDNYDGVIESDIKRMEENAAKLEKDLILKELEALDFLEALGSTRKIVKDLKLELKQKHTRSIESPEDICSQIKEMIHERCHKNPMKQASMNLGKTMDDHSMIQSYVECLNLKTEEAKGFLGVTSLAEELNSLRLIPEDSDQGNRFNTVIPTCEHVKIVTETNDTAFRKQNKTCLKTAEMRLVAARKMEEAARATEELAIAEMTILSSEKKQDSFWEARSPLPLKQQMKEDLSTNISKTKLLMKLEAANEEVKQSKQALEMALNQVEIASMKQLEAEDAFRQWNIESWKYQKAIKARPSLKVDNFPPRSFLSHVNQHEPLIDLPKKVMKRNVPMGNVLNRKHDEKQLVTPRRKFRFIHNTVSEQSKQEHV